jgi:hypothetical protein
MPELMVATTLLDWFQPALTAKVLRFALVWLLAMEKANWLALPRPSDIAIAPLALPNNVRTLD